MEKSARVNYEQRMQADLDRIREAVRRVAELIESQVGDAVQQFEAMWQFLGSRR